MVLATTTLTIGVVGFILALLVLMRDLASARRVRKYAIQATRGEKGVEYTERIRAQNLQEYS